MCVSYHVASIVLTTGDAMVGKKKKTRQGTCGSHPHEI